MRSTRQGARIPVPADEVHVALRGTHLALEQRVVDRGDRIVAGGHLGVLRPARWCPQGRRHCRSAPPARRSACRLRQRRMPPWCLPPPRQLRSDEPGDRDTRVEGVLVVGALGPETAWDGARTGACQRRSARRHQAADDLVDAQETASTGEETECLLARAGPFRQTRPQTQVSRSESRARGGKPRRPPADEIGVASRPL